MSVKTAERNVYLSELASDYGVPMYVVRSLADVLGPDEDYDGLVSALEDYADTLSERENC